MNVYLKTKGSCPVCGDDVPRLVGEAGETYACPTHGPIRYAGSAVPLAQWAQRLSGMTYV